MEVGVGSLSEGGCWGHGFQRGRTRDAAVQHAPKIFRDQSSIVAFTDFLFMFNLHCT